MPTKLIYSVTRLYSEGRQLPKSRLAFIKGVAGLLTIREVMLSGLNKGSRTGLCATLSDPVSNLPVVDFPPLFDVHVLSMTADELVLSGIERPESLVEVNVAQYWLARPIDLLITPEWSPTPEV